MAVKNPVYKLLLSQILVLLILAVCVMAAFGLYQNRPEAPEVEAPVPLLNVDVVKADRVPFREIIYGFGTVTADREVIVAAQISGEVIEVGESLEVGRQVKTTGMISSPTNGQSIPEAGDLLIKIDPDDYLQRQRQAVSRIEEAKTELDRLDVVLESTRRQLAQSKEVLSTLEADLQRKRSAAERRASSETEVSRALLEVQRYQESILQLQNQLDSLPVQKRAAEQRLASSQAEAEQVGNDLERTAILPPFDGVVSEVNVELGQFVRAGEPMFRLTDLSRVEVPVALPLDQFLRLQELKNAGIKPSVILEASDETATTWQGDLVRVAPEADSGSRTVKVFIEVVNRPGQTPLLPGTFVTAAIEGPVTRDKVLIPRESLVDGHVFVVGDDNTVSRRSVTVSKTLQSMAITEDGVQSGDNVVLTNLDLLKNGRAVNVQQQISLQDEVQGLRKSRIRLLSDDDSSSSVTE